MTSGDFIIRYEHKFIQNIYALDQIKESHHLKTIENYYEIYQKFVSISIGLLSMLNNYNKNDNINSEVSEFIEENCADDSIDELKNRTTMCWFIFHLVIFNMKLLLQLHFLLISSSN